MTGRLHAPGQLGPPPRGLAAAQAGPSMQLPPLPAVFYFYIFHFRFLQKYIFIFEIYTNLQCVSVHACMREMRERELLLLIDCSVVLGVEKGEQVLICSVEREQ